MKRTLLLTLSASALALLSACNEPAPPPPEVLAPILQGNQLRFPPGHPQLALLGVINAAPSKAITVELPARLVWNEEQTQRIYPAFAGRVTAIKADVGQPVKAGSLLAQLASPDFGGAQADTAKAQADARLAQKSLQRQRELFEAGIIARKDLEQAEADAARSAAESQRAEARTRMYGGGSGNVNQQLGLLAGITGVVVERNLNPGQEVRPDQSGPGAPALFVVTNPTSLWVQIDARESEVGTLQPGAAFELRIAAMPGEKFEGRVTAASDFIDPATRTIKIRGLVANPGRKLKAEMLATARIERMLGPGVLIPAQAVSLWGTQHMVLVQVQPGVFESREVVLSYEGPREAVVSRGLEAGEQVVSENTLLLAREFRQAQEDARPERNDKKAAPAPQGTASAAIKTVAPAVLPSRTQAQR
ncbi:efflux RND transporter periplasmic adaptor subunit [Polaromonas sp. SM01]|uniref:efflux RND transporter periplasmic adaptor subunit n=1 Tax=Polaromonas sp. SM01 TaxID=3085630 RepID=UPI002981AE88|nr:efflux RND transporter periplasmic adaptor subunit [Polaromonas sp. SM01]MDW5441273.1 efflux RND transporter periplasmic adaptor subunit [Polaromonas sp. SM01]